MDRISKSFSHNCSSMAFKISLLVFTYLISPAWALADDGVRVPVDTSIINTTFNTYQSSTGWEATMGPLSKKFGGIACDHIAAHHGDALKYRRDDYALWFVAPSDSIQRLGLKHCGFNQHGGEPSCQENWNFCGRKIRISCRADSYWCNRQGQNSLLSDIANGKRPLNNYIPEYYIEKTKDAVGASASAPRSIVLYITDFCPAKHSENQKYGHCQSPQLDISTPAFLLLGRQNNEGYIDSGLELEAELLAEGDPSPAGPQY